MEAISKILFFVANSLLIPDIILLLFLFVRSLILLGALYENYMSRRNNEKKFAGDIRHCNQENVRELTDRLPKKENTLFVHYLNRLYQSPVAQEHHDLIISSFENEAQKELSTARLLIKFGPVLGLMGTLIAMSPALVGLSQGDVSGMAYNMQVVFATTVVGLVISMVGLLALQLKQRWFDRDSYRLLFISSLLLKSDQTTKQ